MCCVWDNAAPLFIGVHSGVCCLFILLCCVFRAVRSTHVPHIQCSGPPGVLEFSLPRVPECQFCCFFSDVFSPGPQVFSSRGPGILARRDTLVP